MTEMTKKEMEARITELEGERETILQQAIQLQTVAQNRLVSLRLLEGFVNEVSGALTKFMNDVNELGLQARAEEEESED
jgi:hypothetical protein|tara:strand:- start:2497 stop:2733 length:237 start_codon:yes stop_codon:yes gene_type:complete